MYQDPSKPDVQVENHGSLFLFRPLSDCAEDWIEQHVDVSSATYFGGALVVEPRYVGLIAEGMLEDGLRIAGN
jgi:hypothetical protein